MQSFAFFLTLVAIASAGLIPTPTPTPAPPPECARYSLSSTAVPNPTLISNYIGNVLLYDTVGLMSGTPAGPYFDMNAGDCYWVPNGDFNCGLTLYLDFNRTHQIGTGLLSSTDLATNSTTTTPGFHFVSGSMKLTTNINPSLLSAAASASGMSIPTGTSGVNFASQSTTIYFPARLLLPVSDANLTNAVANGVSYVGTTEFLTLWGSNGGPNWNDSRTTGLDIRVILTCVPPTVAPTVAPSPSHVTVCPTCSTGSVIVPSACISSGAAISQAVSGTCISLSFASSTSTNAYNGCSGGAF